MSAYYRQTVPRLQYLCSMLSVFVFCTFSVCVLYFQCLCSIFSGARARVCLFSTQFSRRCYVSWFCFSSRKCCEIRRWRLCIFCGCILSLTIDTEKALLELFVDVVRWTLRQLFFFFFMQQTLWKKGVKTCETFYTRSSFVLACSRLFVVFLTYTTPIFPTDIFIMLSARYW